MSEPLKIWNVSYEYDQVTVDIATSLPGIGAELVFARMNDGDNGAIWCEASVFIIMPDQKTRVLQPSRTNLMNATKGQGGWKAHLDTLNELAGGYKWQEILGAAVGVAIEKYRKGVEPSSLRISTRDGLGEPWLLEPFIASNGVSVLFGEGGVGKSQLALALALTVASETDIIGRAVTKGNVIYFDYEDDNKVHHDRLLAIATAHGVSQLKHEIFHFPLVAKVSSAQAQMRQVIRDYDAKLVILDSIGMGRGGDAGTAEDTIRLFRALRSLGAPVFALDHVTKEDKRAGTNITPYGSIYTVNSARLLWGVRYLEGPSTFHHRFLSMENTKANHVARQPGRGLEVMYGNDEYGNIARMKYRLSNQWWDPEDASQMDALTELRDMTPSMFGEEIA